MLEQSFDAAVQRHKQQQRYRQRQVFQSTTTCLSFVGNDYLGLSHEPAVLDAAKQAMNQYGIASGGSPAVSGYSAVHQQLEEALAEFTGFEKVILFSSGYVANVGLISALAKNNSVLFVDRDIHASLVDGCLLSRARIYRYPHLQCATLEKKLQTVTDKKKWLITDGVFSADGQLAPLPELLTVAKNHQAYLLVDDAHGMGCLGQNGRGTLEHYQIPTHSSLLLTASFAKAFGTTGAFVAGNSNFIDYLIQFARPYMFSNGLPPAIAAATLASLNVMQQQPWRRTRLQELIDYFQRCAQQLKLPVAISHTAIQTVFIGGSEKVMAAKAALLEQKIMVAALRPPTVQSGQDCLRITLTAQHTKPQLDQLLTALVGLAQKINDPCQTLYS